MFRRYRKKKDVYRVYFDFFECTEKALVMNSSREIGSHPVPSIPIPFHIIFMKCPPPGGNAMKQPHIRANTWLSRLPSNEKLRFSKWGYQTLCGLIIYPTQFPHRFHADTIHTYIHTYIYTYICMCICKICNLINYYFSTYIHTHKCMYVCLAKNLQLSKLLIF